ncbi:MULTISPECIES: FdtA/QdtA family cupin domain-containing protein [Eggerthellaceae]|uniref:sugar 3,4-ketoisomerase n=1 Tax=Eggerthellaceae TaxID=1643826 RepID=UPI002E79BA84|nr:FdtA/QdtA family cupin domain-containing protein [Ellagibacter isourolithinifaciens]MEE0045223.1 FdtA/QdtA family cupin domain-containing protein [Ellagibacter isourolithinifaciens]
MLANVMDIRTIETPGSGSLSFFEAPGDLPFDIKRVYCTYGVAAGTKRGKHAHRALRQMLICPYGEIEVLLDDGRQKEVVLLNDPSRGLIVEPFVWHEMVWCKDESVLMAVASMPYEESDYIRDYGMFLRAINGD